MLEKLSTKPANSAYIIVSLSFSMLTYSILKYPLRCTPDGAAAVHLSGCLNHLLVMDLPIAQECNYDEKSCTVGFGDWCRPWHGKS